MTPWKVTMHCRSEHDNEALSADASGRLVLAEDKILTIRVLGDFAFSVTLELQAASALLAIVEGLVVIAREMVRMYMPDWPATEICAEPVVA